MVVTRDPALAGAVRAMRNHGRGPEGRQLLGYNYRLSEIASALGLAQIKRLPAILARRALIAARYTEELKNIAGIVTPPLRNSWFVYTVLVADRDTVWSEMNAAGIECGRYFAALEPGLPVTDRIAARTLQLPFFNDLSEEQIGQVCTSLRALVQGRRT
jgi:perosamine synthetase